MRKEGMDASDRLDGLLRVHFKINAAIFLGNGQNTCSRHGFERIIAGWMAQANPDGKVVTGIQQEK